MYHCYSIYNQSFYMVWKWRCELKSICKTKVEIFFLAWYIFSQVSQKFLCHSVFFTRKIHILLEKCIHYITFCFTCICKYFVLFCIKYHISLKTEFKSLLNIFNYIYLFIYRFRLSNKKQLTLELIMFLLC